MATYTRRKMLGATAAAWMAPSIAGANDPLAEVDVQIKKQRQEGIKRLQDWVKQPSIAAENRGMSEGCELMIRLAREAGFQLVSRIPTDGQPSVFATLDAGAPRTPRSTFVPAEDP